MTLDEVLERFERVKPVGNGYVALCPAHDDHSPSLSIGEGDDEDIVLYCHAGCDTGSILDAADLTWGDLRQGRDTLEATYDYTDESGALLYQVLRFRPKTFRQRKPDGNGGWIDSMGDVRRVLYRLPELRSAHTAYLVEGEKDADAIAAVGGVATTNVGGAQSWRSEYNAEFAGKRVWIVADRDGPGIKRAKSIASQLESIALDVSVVQAKEGKDAADHLAAGYSLADLVPLDETNHADGLIFERFSRIKVERPEFVAGFEGAIPFGAITLLAGEQGTNKSTLACYVAAQITRLHDGDVIYITTEGDPGIEIGPRLLVHGADVDRCHFASKKRDGFDDVIFFPNDLRDLEAHVKRAGVRLVVVDPALAHVDVADSHNDGSLRTALAPLQMMAQRNKIAVLLIAHLNKDKSTDPFRRVGGSKGLTGIARSNLLLAQDRHSENMRELASFKSSWAEQPQTSMWRVSSAAVPGGDMTTAKIEWFSYSDTKAWHMLIEGRGQH